MEATIPKAPALKARCPACRKLNSVADKTSAVVCASCGAGFTPKFYRRNQAAGAHRCLCGELADKRDGTGWSCARCRGIECRLEHDFVFRFHSGKPGGGIRESALDLLTRDGVRWPG